MAQSEPSPLAERPFDMIVKGGRVIDPASGLDEVADVAVLDGAIAAVAPAISAPAKRVIDAAGKLVTPGLIDTHAHVFQYVSGPFGLNPDEVGVESGVSTLVDQGGPSCLTIDGFRKFIVEPAASNVCCFISTYLAGGLYGHIHSDLYGPEQISVKAAITAIEANRDIVCGVKSHAEPGHYSRWGVEVLKKSKEIARAVNLPTYVHLGTLWPVRNGANVDPAQLLAEVIPLLDKGDVLAHPFTRYPSGFTDETGALHPLVREAIARGVAIDVGRGNHFSIRVAEAVLGAGVLPDTLGADLHGYNITRAANQRGAELYAAAHDGRRQNNDASIARGKTNDPAFSLHYAMSEMLALGVPLPHVVAMVTANAAKLIGAESKLGSLAPGRSADIAIIDLQHDEFVMVDGCGETMKAAQRVRPYLTIRSENVVHPSSGYLPFWEREAA